MALKGWEGGRVTQDVTPSMPEIELLVDALKGLDELFLVVVVGEFNSGKSTVINALLGNRFLPDGILPTTNEISIIKFRSAFHLPAIAFHLPAIVVVGGCSTGDQAVRWSPAHGVSTLPRVLYSLRASSCILRVDHSVP